LSKSEKKEQEVVEDHDNTDLRGTFFFNMVIGAFLLFSWIGVWAIYMSRL